MKNYKNIYLNGNLLVRKKKFKNCVPVPETNEI